MTDTRETLAQQIHRACARRGVSIREAGRQAGVSSAVISRAYNGLPFDWLGYVKITAWLAAEPAQASTGKAA